LNKKAFEIEQFERLSPSRSAFVAQRELTIFEAAISKDFPRLDSLESLITAIIGCKLLLLQSSSFSSPLLSEKRDLVNASVKTSFLKS
jgi:hypothetical protein